MRMGPPLLSCVIVAGFAGGLQAWIASLAKTAAGAKDGTELSESGEGGCAPGSLMTGKGVGRAVEEVLPGVGGLGYRIARRAAGAEHLRDLAERMALAVDRLLRLLQRDQRAQRRVHVDLLLDRGELDELLGELVGVERRKWVLVLKLRGEQYQEGIEVAGDGAEACG